MPFHSRTVPFTDLRQTDAPLAEELREAAARVLASGWYVLGPEVEQFEAEFAAFHGVRHAVGVANGTDAIELALRALDIGSGAEVITVAHTAVATVCAIERAGATPVLVDIDPLSYTMDPAAAAAAITPRTQAIVPVHLYGHPAACQPLRALADRHHLALIEDCAQAHGARYDGRRVGTFGDLAAFSFYPTKNLSAYGDGGAILTNDSGLDRRLRRLRSYGQSSRYVHEQRGINSRLDELQAALLKVKLHYLDEHNSQRRQLAARYDRTLQSVITPRIAGRGHALEHVYHLYVVRHPQRDILRQLLERHGVETLIHYPRPVHLQAAYTDLKCEGDLPVTERVAAEVLSLPLRVGMTEAELDRVAAAIREPAREAA